MTLKAVKNAAELVGARIRRNEFDGYDIRYHNEIICTCIDVGELREALEELFGGHAQWQDAKAEMAG